MTLTIIFLTEPCWELAFLKLAEFGFSLAHKRELWAFWHTGVRWDRQIFSIRRQQAGGQQKNPILKFNIACTMLQFPWNTPQVLGKDCITSWSFINGALENWEKILSKFRTNEAERKYQAAGVQIRLATGIKRTWRGDKSQPKTDKNPSGILRKSWKIYPKLWKVTEIIDLIGHQ